MKDLFDSFSFEPKKESAKPSREPGKFREFSPSSGFKPLDDIYSQAQKNLASKNTPRRTVIAREAPKNNVPPAKKPLAPYAGMNSQAAQMKKVAPSLAENWKRALPKSFNDKEKGKSTMGRILGIDKNPDAYLPKDKLIKMGQAIDEKRWDDPILKNMSKEEITRFKHYGDSKDQFLGGIGKTVGGQWGKKWKNN